MEFLLLRKEHASVQPTPDIELAWCTLLLMPCFADLVYREFGFIVDRAAIAGPPATTDDIRFRCDIYFSVFGKPCSWDHTAEVVTPTSTTQALSAQQTTSSPRHAQRFQPDTMRYQKTLHDIYPNGRFPEMFG